MQWKQTNRVCGCKVDWIDRQIHTVKVKWCENNKDDDALLGSPESKKVLQVSVEVKRHIQMFEKEVCDSYFCLHMY